MNIEQGMKVRDVRGKHLGIITARHSCCIEFGEGLAARTEAIFAADTFGIELICDGSELARYRCGLHPARRTGTAN